MDQNRTSSQLKHLLPNFQGLTVQNVGEGRFEQQQFEQVQQQNSEDQDFGFEEEQQACGKSDSQPYKKSIGLGPKDKAEVDHSKPQLRINGYQFVWGHNPGQHTFTVVEGQPSLAVGTNIFYRNRIHQGHNYTITYLSYNPVTKILLSGTQGKCSQIRIWQVTSQGNLVPFGEKPRYNLPMNSLGVGFAFIQAQMLVVITRYNLHRSSQIFTFDLQTGKRSHCLCKLGKVVHLEKRERVLVLTEKGVSALEMLAVNQCKVTAVVGSNEVSCFEERNGEILTGCLDGRVEVWSGGEKCGSAKVHEKNVFCVRRGEESSTILSAGSDGLLVLLQYNQQEKIIQKRQVVELHSPCLNLTFSDPTTLHLTLKSTQTVTYTLTENALKLIQNTHPSPLHSPSPSPSLTPHLLYNKYSQKYYYSLSDTPLYSVLTFNDSKFTSCRNKQLKHSPSKMDIAGNLLAFVYKPIDDCSKNMFNKSAIKGLLGFAFKQAKINLETLYLQDLTEGSIKGELELPEKDSCTIIRMTPTADKIAIGYFSGSVQLYSINNPQSITILKRCHLHASPLTELLWDEQARLIKSISRDNLLYLDILKDKQTLAPTFTSKGLEGVEWPNCGKYDWKSYRLWNARVRHPDEVKDIVESYDYLLVILQDGGMEVYRNPASKEGQNLGKLFEHGYQCRVVYDDGDRMTVLVATAGVLFCLELAGAEQEEEEGEEPEQSE